jgi:hypothetical protein
LGVARQCIFCSNPANSKEDLWPKWILKRLDIKRPIRHTIGQRSPKILPRPQIRVGTVCNICNAGWMHDLENANIPLIGCLMENISTSLDAEQQLTIARWAVKTAMVQDSIYTHTRKLFYTDSERAEIRAHLTIPNDTLVWLGQCSLRTLAVDGYDVGLDFQTVTEIAKPANGTVSTFILGHLTLQVLTIHVPEPYRGRPWEARVTIDGPWDRLLVPVWPTTRSVSWPPSLHFKGGKGINMLNSRLRGGKWVRL